MYTIKAQKLTPEAFRKYGVYQDLLDNEALKQSSIFPQNFFADVVTLDFGNTNLPTISVCHVKKTPRNIISFLEAHKFTCEGLLPLDGDVIIFVGTDARNFNSKDLEAFYVPKGTFVKLNPLIVHGTQYAVNEEEVHIVCMLPGRTFANDIIPHPLPEDEKVEIIL